MKILRQIKFYIAKLIELRRTATTQEQKVINKQLEKLYGWKYQIIKEIG